MKDEIIITNREYWFKVVDMLQQNWALIDSENNSRWRVYFFGDTSGIFDEMIFISYLEAEDALKKNGFRRYDEDKEAHKFIATPKPPFYRKEHPNGKIYSSGRFWK